MTTYLLLGGLAFLGFTLLWAVLPHWLRKRHARPAGSGRPEAARTPEGPRAVDGRPLAEGPRAAGAPSRETAAPPAEAPRGRPAAAGSPNGRLTGDGRLPLNLRNGAQTGSGQTYRCDLQLPGLPAVRIPIQPDGGTLPGYQVEVLGLRLRRGNLQALREDLGELLGGLVRRGRLPGYLVAVEGLEEAWPVYRDGDRWELAIPQGPVIRAPELEELLVEAAAHLAPLGSPAWRVFRVAEESLALEPPLAMVSRVGGPAVSLPLHANPGPAALRQLADQQPLVAEALRPELVARMQASVEPSGYRLSLASGGPQPVRAMRWDGLYAAFDEEGRACLGRDPWELRDAVAWARRCPPEQVSLGREPSPGSAPTRILQEG